MLRNAIAPFDTYSNEIGASGFNVKIEKVEHNSMREVSKRTIVHYELFAGIDHL